MLTEANNQRVFEKISETKRLFLSDDAGLRPIKVSPYLYRKGLSIVRTQKRECSRMAMRQLVKDGRFSKLQEQILYILEQFGFLNSYLIRVRISSLTGKTPMKKELMRAILKSLVDDGLLVQYELVYTDAEGKKQGSPFIYGLASGGRRYLKEQCRKKRLTIRYPNEEVSCGLLLRILAENQFAVSLENQFRNRKILTYSDFSGSVYQACGVRMFYTLQASSESEIALYAFSVRQDEGWEDLFLVQLNSLCTYMVRSGTMSSSILVIVDTEWLAMGCEEIRCANDSLSALDVFYATDTSFVEEDSVFDRLIEVRKEQNEMIRSVFRLELNDTKIEESAGA